MKFREIDGEWVIPSNETESLTLVYPSYWADYMDQFSSFRTEVSNNFAELRERNDRLATEKVCLAEAIEALKKSDDDF